MCNTVALVAQYDTTVNLFVVGVPPIAIVCMVDMEFATGNIVLATLLASAIPLYDESFDCLPFVGLKIFGMCLFPD